MRSTTFVLLVLAAVAVGMLVYSRSDRKSFQKKSVVVAGHVHKGVLAKAKLPSAVQSDDGTVRIRLSPSLSFKD